MTQPQNSDRTEQPEEREPGERHASPTDTQESASAPTGHPRTTHERLDWFGQDPQPSAASHPDADPVLTVRQLPRFRIGTRRFTGQVDHALVCVTRKGVYETFSAPDRPRSLRRYAALYEVDTDFHAFRLNVPLPSDVDTFEFDATADISWRVARPARFVLSQERDVPALVARQLVPLLRDASRGHPVEDSAEAERAVRRAVRDAPWLGQEQGLRVTCTVRLRRDAAERLHQARLRTARHDAEASGPEHLASLLRAKQEAERRAELIRFYESTLTRGGTAALAVHLAAHPDQTQLVLEHLQAGQNKLVDTQIHLIDQAMESRQLEDDHLEEPRQLVAERMAALLRTAALAEDEPSPSFSKLPPPSTVPTDDSTESAT